MSNWKVFKTKISLFTHPNADSLLIGKVGSYQVVIQKGLYNDGDDVIFAPEKSILTGTIKNEYEKYLSGADKNRVKSVRLRGEISCGIIIPKHFVPDFDSYDYDTDISEFLEITHYEPPIPQELLGKVNTFSLPFIGSHDCEHYGVYANEFIDGERVVISEKNHGSQIIIAHDTSLNETIVSSKGLLKRGLSIEESDGNVYWIATKNDDILNKIKNNFNHGVIQLFGEVIPIQSGYTYGSDKLKVLLFDIRVDGESIPYDKVPDDFKKMWVPVLFDDNITMDKKEVVLYSDPEKGIHKTKIEYLLPKSIIDLCKGNELVSGKELHIREGVVIRPYLDRNAKDGTKLRLKIINPDYKETGEEIN